MLHLEGLPSELLLNFLKALDTPSLLAAVRAVPIFNDIWKSHPSSISTMKLQNSQMLLVQD